MSLLDKIVKLLGDPDAMPGAKKKGPVTLPTDHSLHKDDFAVVGMHYHPQSFARLQVANPEWRTAKKKILEAEPSGKVIFHYTYINKPVTLQLDPSNEYGVDRVMVFIAGEHVGYLSEDNDAHAREILQYGSVKYITARITGGEYKRIFADGTEQKDAAPLHVNVRIAYSV